MVNMEKSWYIDLKEWCNTERLLSEWEDIMKAWDDSMPKWEDMSISDWHQGIYSNRNFSRSI